MNSSWFIVTYILLWVVSLASLALLLATLRQIGVLHGRLGPRAALQMEDVPKLRSELPELTLRALDGSSISIPSDRPLTAAVILNPGCIACEELAPGLRTLMRDPPGDDVAILVLVSTGPVETEAFAQQYRLERDAVMSAPDIPALLEIESTPLALIMDRNRQVLSSGVVNSLEELEVLIGQGRIVHGEEEADELDETLVGVASDGS